MKKIILIILAIIGIFYVVNVFSELELDTDNDTLLLAENEGNMTAKDFDLAGKIIKVIDGDTVVIESGEKIRLSIVNTPERWQQGYQEAKQFTVNLCLGKEALVDIDDKQQKSYNRVVGAVFCDGGQFLNKLLIDEGLAVVWDKYCIKSEFKEILC